MPDPLLTLRAVNKAFDQEPIIRDVSFEVQSGEFLALLGPSGCGKTTLLRIIAGLEQPDSGEILCEGKSLLNLTPQKRPLHTVFQHYALFPHMTVFDNVAFPLRAKGVSQSTLAQKVEHALSLTQLEDLSQRYPASLSGGQQQRVAIARAIVDQPKIVLLDESLSALDAKLRQLMQIELKRLQRRLGVTFIYVTHSQEEALAMADRMIVIVDGCVQQIGTPRQVYEEPQNLTVAKFIGEANVFDLEVETATTDWIVFEIEQQSFQFTNTQGFSQGQRAHLVIRPEDLRINREKLDTLAVSPLPAVIDAIIYRGSTVDLMVRLSSGKMLLAQQFFNEDDEDLLFTLGETVWVHWYPGWEVILADDSNYH